MTTTPDVLMNVPIENIRPNPVNARTTFDETKLKELAQSIKSTGLQQLPVVQEGEGGIYTLESGERRFRACKMLGWATIPCLVKKRESLAESEIAGLAENVQRDNLTPYDLSVKLAAIKTEHKLQGSTIAKMLGLSASYVNVLISLQEDLSDNVKGQWKAGNPKATLDFLRPLMKVPKAKQIEAFVDEPEGEGDEKGPKALAEKKRNVRRAAEQLMAAMLKMSKEDCAAINARECVSFILGSRTRAPAGITFSDE